MIWIVFIAMTVAVLAVLLRPVMQSGAVAGTPDREAYDRAIFRDQLAELDRDLARGAIGAREAEAARNEIARRLIGTAAVTPQDAAPRLPAWALMLGMLIIPAVAVPLYLRNGQPSLPDVPLAARLDNAIAAGDFDALIVKVERHLAEQPDDVKGWQVLAPAYRKAQRWDDAADAYVNILKRQPPDAATLADYAEMLVFANQGLVSADAGRTFAEALQLDPQLPKARFYAALALKQEGNLAGAKAAFEALLAATPADAGYRPMLEAELRDLAAPPAANPDAAAAIQSMSEGDQQAAIRSMVDGLEQRLNADGSDLDGWLRLIRARSVLNEQDKAVAAYATAKQKFKDRPDALAALDGLAKELNIP